MKKYICLFLAVLLAVLCTACGSFAEVNLQESVTISADGIVAKNVFAQLQKEASIGTFCGQSGGMDYEWTVFGSDITEAKDLNLLVDITKEDDGVELTLSSQQPFGFSALLSVKLDELWYAQTATAYQGEKAVASVSLTGNKQTVLNLSLDGSVQKLTVRADELPEGAVLDVVKEEQKPQQTTQETTQQAPAAKDDSYLSGVNKAEDKTYSQSGTATEKDTSDKKTDNKNNSVDASYTTPSGSSSGRVYSDGTQTGKDQYQTDPVPVGKPMPVEPENQDVNKTKSFTCTFSIECSTILNNLSDLDPDKLELVPSNGVILAKTKVTVYEGESVYDVLQRLCKEKGIHMESSWTPIYNSAYVEGIHNLYEFDCGALSGWMYRVNGWYPNYGCSRYQLQEGDLVEWRYTCDLGYDVGGAYAVTGQSE